MSDQASVEHIKRLDYLFLCKDAARATYLAEQTLVNRRRYLFCLERYQQARRQGERRYGLAGRRAAMTVRILTGDCREILPTMPERSVQCCVTSPPYWGLRSYMPDTVKLRGDLTDEECALVLAELERLNTRPIGNEV